MTRPGEGFEERRHAEAAVTVAVGSLTWVEFGTKPSGPAVIYIRGNEVSHFSAFTKKE